MGLFKKIEKNIRKGKVKDWLQPGGNPVDSALIDSLQNRLMPKIEAPEMEQTPDAPKVDGNEKAEAEAELERRKRALASRKSGFASTILAGKNPYALTATIGKPQLLGSNPEPMKRTLGGTPMFDFKGLERK